ncbi:MAG TPA: GNAT family N-acetyltransferase [Candidatus Eisenbacteria bacterium]
MTFVVETIRDRGRLEALRDDWDALSAGTPDRSPFLTYDWFRCCLEDSEGAELFVLAAREGDRLVGIAPLCRERLRIRWRRARAIGFLRCRETPQADLVVEPARRAAVLDAILRHLHEAERASWDLLLLTPWLETSANLSLVREWIDASGARRLERQASLAPVVPISGTWDEFWKGRSYLFRKSRRGILKRMQRVGEVEIECHRADPRGEALQALFDVSDRSWKRAEGKAVTSREESKRFFRALTETAGRHDWLRLWILRVNGTPIATEYDLAQDGVVYALRADFDQSHASFSPGAYLEYHLLERLFEEGNRAYHAGPGSDTYKLRWTEEQRRCVTFITFNRGWSAALLWLAEGWAVPRLKGVRDRLFRSEPVERA